jgi:DNA-binding transcriptional MerR regulator
MHALHELIFIGRVHMWLKIGEFANLSRVSARMLRHYDRVGLLKPIHPDESTGYRYYSIEQLPRLKRICALRDLAFTLEEIALLLADDEPAMDLRELLERKQQELRQRMAEDQVRLQRIEVRLQTLDQECHMEIQTERELFTLLLAEQYGINALEMQLVHSLEPVSCFYHVHGSDGTIWNLYAGRADALADSVYTTWLSGYAGYSLPDFLLSRAGILMHLEAQAYTTQRAVRTQTGMVLGYRAGWSVLVTTALQYRLTEPTRANFRALGTTLAHLHTLKIAPHNATALPIGISWFYPEHALREALQYMGMARDQIPTQWHGLLSAFHATLHTIQHTPLPRTLIHGDPYIDKAVIAEDGQVRLREWHSGGLGVAVLDLGRLLYACHLNSQERWPWTITPDALRITAVLDGYLAHRTLNERERAVLREAIQFSIAYGGTEHIASTLTTGWTPKIERKLAARQQWFTANNEIARIAHAFLG